VIRDCFVVTFVFTVASLKSFLTISNPEGDLGVPLVGTVECSVIVGLEMLHCKMNLMAQRVVTNGSFLILTAWITE
jgi:hypothetical protein